MDTVDQYRDEILKINEFVKGLDPEVRAEAFRFLLERTGRTGGGSIAPPEFTPLAEASSEESEAILKRLSEESGIPLERLMEIYACKGSTVQVVDCSIPNEGPADLVKKITLLCAYGNVVGRKLAKVEVGAIFRNLKDLNVATTSYSRDVRKAEGVKVFADGVMVPPDGRQKAQALLKQTLKLQG